MAPIVASCPEDIQAIIPGLAVNPQILVTVAQQMSISTTLGGSQSGPQKGEMSKLSTSGKFKKLNTYSRAVKLASKS